MSKNTNKRRHIETKTEDIQLSVENNAFKKKLKKLLKKDYTQESFTELDSFSGRGINIHNSDDLYEEWGNNLNNLQLSTKANTQKLTDNNVPSLNNKKKQIQSSQIKSKKLSHSNVNDDIKVKNTTKVENDMITTISNILSSKNETKSTTNASKIQSNYVVEEINNEKVSSSTAIKMLETEPNIVIKKKKKSKTKNKSTKMNTEKVENKVLLPKCSNDSSNSSTVDFNDELANQIKQNIKKKLSTIDTTKYTKLDCEEDEYCMMLDESYDIPHTSNEKFEYNDSVIEIFDKSYKSKQNMISIDNPIIFDHITESNNISEYENPSEIIDVNISSSIPFDVPVDEPVDVPVVSDDPFKFFPISNACIAIFRHSTPIFFCGKLKASILHGNVEVLGHKLTKKPEDLYSVCTASLLCFETTKSEENLDGLSSNLRAVGVDAEMIAEIIDNILIGDAVLHLEPLKNVMTEFVMKHLTNFNIFSRTQHPEIDDVFNILQCKFYSEGSMSVFSKNETWNDITQLVTFPQEPLSRNVTMLCGGKDVGKSTMLRYMVNKSLEYGPSLVLDFDPGQPEFTICGSLSATVVQNPLLGSNFTHLIEPEKSLCLGYINVMENEKRYINAVSNLVEYCKTSGKYDKMSWIVNTMGFVGMKGYNLLINIMNIINPTTVVEIKSFLSNQNFKTTLTADGNYNFQQSPDFISFVGDDAPILHDYKYFSIKPFQSQEAGKQPTVCKHIEAKSERLLNVLAYFSQMASEKYASILNIKPYVVSMDAISIIFNNIHVDFTYLPCILNGRVIALCQTATTSKPEISELKDQPVDCHGYGLIRGIDVAKRLLYILTPLDVNILKRINAVVYGDTLPDCSSVLSVPNMPSKMTVPYTAPLKVVSKHKHLHQIPKRKLNPLRIIEMAKRS